MRKRSLAAVSAALVALSLDPRPCRSEPKERFTWGVSVSSGGANMYTNLDDEFVDRLVAKLKEGGFDAIRYELTWRRAEGIGCDPDHPVLRFVRRVREAGIQVIPIVGVGAKTALPDDVHPDADPEAYLARVTAHVEEVSKALRPFGLARFQIENELNAAGLAALPLYGWREGRCWYDLEWKTRLLASLAAAVKKHNPEAKVYTNFHDVVTDPETPPSSDPVRGKTDMLSTLLSLGKDSPRRLARVLERWGPLLDEVGLDFYPNYALPAVVPGGLVRTPACFGAPREPTPPGYLLATEDPGKVLKARVSWYGATSKKPVLIAEVGYPSWSPAGHTPALQYEFARIIAKAARSSGATGLIYFRLHDSDSPPPLKERVPWDPNKSIEPFFGLLDDRLQPKTGTVRYPLHVTLGQWSFDIPFLGPSRTVSAWSALVDAIHADHEAAPVPRRTGFVEALPE